MGKFKNGDIVYWCKYNCMYSKLLKHSKLFYVEFGMVDEEFADEVYIDYLLPMETRLINGIPINEFKDDKFHKLPKGWTHSTQLYELTNNYDAIPEEIRGLKISNPEDIKRAYQSGFYIKGENKFQGSIDVEITKEGYRVVLRYQRDARVKKKTSIEKHRLYFTYEEALRECEERTAEIERQANLTDKEWAIEQIEKTFQHYTVCSGYTPDTEIYKRYHDFIMGLKNIEDVEVRVSMGDLQWKYCKNKKWLNIEV